MRKYAEVKMPDDTVMTAKEIVKLRKRLAALSISISSPSLMTMRDIL